MRRRQAVAAIVFPVALSAGGGALPALLAQRAIAAGPTEQAGLTATEMEEFVAEHNRIRREVGVGPVVWSPKLAAFAQAWADELARTGRFEHRPADGEWARVYGENLAIGFGDAFGVRSAVAMWYDERKSYTAGEPIPAEFSELKAGHYTQLVWRGTTAVGAGKAILQTGERKGWTVIVANYDPSGNVTGEKPY
jgi:pathogenesis-related protein 1